MGEKAMTFRISTQGVPGCGHRRPLQFVQLLSMFLLSPLAGPLPARVERDLTVRGVRFEGTADLPDGPVGLRGATLCRYWGFKVYTAAFYTTPEARSLEDILGPAPKRLVLHYNRRIKADEIIEASEHALRNNPDVDVPALRERLNRIYSWYEDVREGDRFHLDYTPGQGSSLYFNGRLKGVIEGEDFARAFFGIWLSDYSLDNDYRDRLLGR